MKKIIKTLLIMLTILVSSISVMAYSTDHDKVYDSANLFTEEEIQQLTKLAKEKGDAAKLDIVIWTVDEYMSGTAMSNADDFYDENLFGYEDCDGSGTILLIDMYSREIYVSTAGLAILYMDDDCINDTLDDIYEYMSDGDYYEACVAYINDVYYAYDDCSSIYSDSIECWYAGEYTNYDDFYDSNVEEWDSAVDWPTVIFRSVIAGLIIAVIVVIILYTKQKTAMAANSKTYLVPGSVNYLVRTDQYINTTTTSRKIETSSGSGGSGGHGGSSHHSSSGRSHGGGGRSF